MKLPPPVSTYFEVDQSQDGGRLLDVFAPDAVVKDEGATHVGHAQILSWWRAAKDKYQHRAQPIEFRENDVSTLVRAEVTGDFPGSPAVIGFSFHLQGDRISRLEIGA